MAKDDNGTFGICIRCHKRFPDEDTRPWATFGERGKLWICHECLDALPRMLEQLEAADGHFESLSGMRGTYKRAHYGWSEACEAFYGAYRKAKESDDG